MRTQIRHLMLGITGLAGCGKSLAASALEDGQDFTRVSFAAPLKRMLLALGVSSHDKEACPPVLCGQTVRHALQTLGTEWGRQMIGSDIWVNAAMEHARHRLPVVFDDVRFENEARAIRQAGGKVIRILRPGTRQMDHASEAGIPASLIDLTLENIGTAEDLSRWIIEWNTTIG